MRRWFPTLLGLYLLTLLFGCLAFLIFTVLVLALQGGIGAFTILAEPILIGLALVVLNGMVATFEQRPHRG